VACLKAVIASVPCKELSLKLHAPQSERTILYLLFELGAGLAQSVQSVCITLVQAFRIHTLQYSVSVPCPTGRRKTQVGSSTSNNIRVTEDLPPQAMYFELTTE
jgi:hypothetical protein